MHKKDQENTTNKTFNTGVFFRILQYAKTYKWQFISTSIAAIVLSFLATARPIILIQIVNKYISPKNEEGLFILIVLMFGFLYL